MYNKWLHDVEIGILVLKWSPHRIFESGAAGSKLVWPLPTFHAKRLSEFGLIQAILSISTLIVSHCKYDEWFCKIEIGICHVMYNHHHTPSFELLVVTILAPATLSITPRWSMLSMFGLIQEFHSISTLSTSH